MEYHDRVTKEEYEKYRKIAIEWLGRELDKPLYNYDSLGNRHRRSIVWAVKAIRDASRQEDSVLSIKSAKDLVESIRLEVFPEWDCLI